MQNEKIVKFMAPDGTPMIQAPENELEKIVSNAVERIAIKLFPRKKEYVNRQQVAGMFQITLPTPHAWVNAGKLVSYKIGGRTLFDVDNELTALNRAAGIIERLPIYTDDRAQVSMSYIRNHSRIMAKKCKCDIIFIDYLQLTDCASGERDRNRENEIAQASRMAKIIAKELDIPVILLPQQSQPSY